MAGTGGAYSGRNIQNPLVLGKGPPTYLAPNGAQYNQTDATTAAGIVWINTSGPGLVGTTWTLLSVII